MKEKEKLNIKELSDHIGCCVSTIRRWIKYKNLPYKMDGYKYAFILKDISKWLKENGKNKKQK